MGKEWINTENFNKELENITKNQWKLKNTITEMKSILEGINTRPGYTEEHVSDLEDRIMEIAQWEQQPKKKLKKKKKKTKERGSYCAPGGEKKKKENCQTRTTTKKKIKKKKKKTEDRSSYCGSVG